MTDEAEARLQSLKAAAYLIEQEKDEPEDEEHTQVVAFVDQKGYATIQDIQLQFKMNYRRARPILARMLSEGILDVTSMRRIRRENGRMADGWRLS